MQQRLYGTLVTLIDLQEKWETAREPLDFERPGSCGAVTVGRSPCGGCEEQSLEPGKGVEIVKKENQVNGKAVERKASSQTVKKWSWMMRAGDWWMRWTSDAAFPASFQAPELPIRSILRLQEGAVHDQPLTRNENIQDPFHHWVRLLLGTLQTNSESYTIRLLSSTAHHISILSDTDMFRLARVGPKRPQWPKAPVLAASYKTVDKEKQRSLSS